MLAGTLPCCVISPGISAEQVTDFLQHRLLKLKPGHTAGADPLPLMNSLAIRPRWQAVVERWSAFLVIQRQLKPAAEGYQVYAGEEREGEHPHFNGHDLTLSQTLHDIRNELSLLNDAQWSPESLAFNHPTSTPYIQKLATICQQLAQHLQRPVRLLEVGTRTGRTAKLLLAQLSAEQIEYAGPEQSQEMLLNARQRLVPWPGARLSLWNTGTLTAHARSTGIIQLNNALHRLLPEDPRLLTALQQLAVPDTLLYVMGFCQLTPSTLPNTLLLTNRRPEASLHNSADWAALFSTAGSNYQHGDEIAGLQRSLVQYPSGQMRRDPR